jgi:hypothetical protein
MSKKTQDMTSTQVLEALRSGPFQEPAHCWLYEVNNATGGRGGRQFADALAISLWPSRGIWFAGIEVKVSRPDWTREVRDPEKSSEIQGFCDYWWVAAPIGVIPIAEVPTTWGLLEIDGKKVLRTKDAPKLDAKPLTKEFVASIFRNEAGGMQRARQMGLDEGRKMGFDEFGPDKVVELQGKLDETTRELHRIQQQLEWKARDLASLSECCRVFEECAGLPKETIAARSWVDMRNVCAQFKAAQLMAGLNTEHIARQFADVASALRALPKADTK